MEVIFGADHAGTLLKEDLKKMLAKEDSDITIKDVSPSRPEQKDDYPDYAFRASLQVADHQVHSRVVLICDTGIGMAIAANKVLGMHAALVHNSFEAKRAREHNNANVIVFGSELIRSEDAFEALMVFLRTPFSDKIRHKRRVEKIKYFEKYGEAPQ